RRRGATGRLRATRRAAGDTGSSRQMRSSRGRPTIGGSRTMTEAGWVALQQRLLTQYKVFKKRLTKYLGSADLAGDVLQDTWLRLERGGEISSVRSPDNYLYSMAVNIARNHIQAENRRLSATEIQTLLDVEDESPNAARVVEARSELEALVGITAELSDRQR